MKKAANYITIFAFFLLLAMFAVSTVFFQKKVSFSEEIKKSENAADIFNNYAADNFPLQANWKTLYANTMVLLGKEQFGDIFILDDKLVKSYPKADKEKTSRNIQLLNEFALSTNTPVYAMIAPTAAGIYSSSLPEYATETDQKDEINSIYLELDKKISTIDAFYPLYSARDEYIYYRTDSKWTSFGAYYTYIEAAKRLGNIPQTLSNYDQEYAAESYYGELYQKVYYSGIQADRINLFRSKYQSTVVSVELTEGEKILNSKSVYFRSALNTEKKTNIFLQGDSCEKVTIKTSVKDAPKLLIIKGSYANTLAPFFTPHYSEITLADPALIKKSGKKLSDIVNVNDYDQVLVMYDIENFSEAEGLDILCG